MIKFCDNVRVYQPRVRRYDSVLTASDTQQPAYASALTSPDVSTQQPAYASVLTASDVSRQQHAYASVLTSPDASRQQHAYASVLTTDDGRGGGMGNANYDFGRAAVSGHGHSGDAEDSSQEFAGFAGFAFSGASTNHLDV